MDRYVIKLASGRLFVDRTATRPRVYASKEDAERRMAIRRPIMDGAKVMRVVGPYDPTASHYGQLVEA